MAIDSSFVQDIIAAHQAGLAEFNAKQDRAHQKLLREFQIKSLRHEQDREKLHDLAENLGIAQALHGQQAQTPGQPGGTATTETPVFQPPDIVPAGDKAREPAPSDLRPGGLAAGLQAIINRSAPLKPMPIQGIPESVAGPTAPFQDINVGEGDSAVQIPGTNLEQTISAQMAAEARKRRGELEGSIAQKQVDAAFAPPIVKPVDSELVDRSGNVLSPGTPKPDTFDKEQSLANAMYRDTNKLSPNAPLSELQKGQARAFYNQTVKKDPDAAAQLTALRNLEMASRQMSLSQQPTPAQAQQVADDLVKHRIAPEQMAQMFGGFGPAGQNFKRMVYAEAKKLDSEFDFEQAASEYGLVKSPAFQTTVRYMDSVQSSIPQLLAASDKLARTNIQSINRVLNVAKDQTGGVDVKRFNTDRVLLADEIAKILQGGGTGGATSDAKLRQAEDILKSEDSPAQIKTALEEVQGLISSRRVALTKGTYLANGTQPAGVSPGSLYSPTSRPGTEGAAKPTTFTMPDGTVLALGSDGKYYATK